MTTTQAPPPVPPALTQAPAPTTKPSAPESEVAIPTKTGGVRVATAVEVRILAEIDGIRKRAKGRPCTILIRFDEGPCQIFEAIPVCNRFSERNAAS